MNLQMNLNGIVSQYAILEPETDIWHEKIPVTRSARQKIEMQFITILSQFLIQDGGDDAAIQKHYKKLQRYLHPDKLKNTFPEVIWLEAILSEGRNDGACTRLLKECKDKLLPQPEASSAYNAAQTMDDLLYLLQQRRLNASTLTQQILIDQLIELLKASANYKETVKTMGPDWIQISITAMPYITSGFCMGLFVQELALLYALVYALSLGGTWCEQSGSQQWQNLAVYMKQFSQRLSDASLALLSCFIRCHIFAFRGLCYAGISACSQVYQSLVAPVSLTAASGDPSSMAALLLPESVSLLNGLVFRNMELKMMALPLEAYLSRQESQYFASWRTGQYKSRAVKATLNQLSELDGMDLPLHDKLRLSKTFMTMLVNNPLINVPGSEASRVIAQVLGLLGTFSEEAEAQAETSLEPWWGTDAVRSLTYAP